LLSRFNSCVWCDQCLAQAVPPECNQQKLFDASGVKHLIDSAMQGTCVCVCVCRTTAGSREPSSNFCLSHPGYACTAFAFGQTGSGKTHTITGPDGGMLLRLF
jgi:hypothetical protein